MKISVGDIFIKDCVVCLGTRFKLRVLKFRYSPVLLEDIVDVEILNPCECCILAHGQKLEKTVGNLILFKKESSKYKLV